MAGDGAVQLAHYIAVEQTKFHQRLTAAIEQYQSTGELPPSVFTEGLSMPHGGPDSPKRGPGRPKKKDNGDKRKRNPSAFNMFVKERMAELKAAGVHAEGDERNPLFTLAAQQWKQLPEGERQERVAKHKAHLEQAGVDELAGHADDTPQQIDTLPAAAKPAPAAAAAPAPSANGDSAAPPAAAELPVKKEKKRKHKEKTEGAAAASADVPMGELAAAAQLGGEGLKKKKKKKKKHQIAEGAES